VWHDVTVFHCTYIPSQPLSEFVDLFWYHDGFDLPDRRESHLPTGTAELVISLNHDIPRNFCGAITCGPFSRPFAIETAQQLSLIGVNFKPGGAFPFFNLPAGELHNLHVPLDELWEARAAELRERLLAARTVEAKFHLLERFLLAQAASSPQIHPAVARALRQFRRATPGFSVAEIAGQVGLSQRHFIQLFRNHVGLTPKLFLRIQRFQRALQAAGARQRVDWADLALDCGYFDQAHFIHEFRTFSGLTPSSWLASRRLTTGHNSLAD